MKEITKAKFINTWASEWDERTGWKVSEEYHKQFSEQLEYLINQEVEKRIAEIDQHGRIAVSVIKKKLWSMRFNEDDVRRETDGRRKRFIYGYTEAINDIAQWLMDTVSQNTRSRLVSQKTEGGTKYDFHKDWTEGGGE